ncbi:hypothetical protein U5A82_16355 [Sphingobium sp. CR2-8]|uniref:hypothetical protein n=1 Tax=Sphingobium sp. CR2-8 TaxID=1306534 RepID=UPI002DB69683|nr:hypothetical protein [Sphingobium sp. CR2-8]MEC3911987.1 hypothetical protein [Sphingobium sp. CR2-8]
MTKPDLLRFTPVPHVRRARGWTPDAQMAFIAALSRCGVVAQAARSVGCTPRSAYYLRARVGAESFAAAWDWALEMGLDDSRARAVALARGQEERPIVRRGRVVGTCIATNHRLLFAALRALGAERSGARAAMPHRERIATRQLFDQIARMGPYSPDEWAALRPALAALGSGGGGGAPPAPLS